MKLIVVTNRLLCKDSFLERIEQICKANPYRIILREKDMPISEYKRLAKKVNQICSSYQVPFVLNGQNGIEIKQSIETTYIQLPYSNFLAFKQTDLKASFQEIIVSIHTKEEALKAQQLGASSLIAGHIFPTRCKEGVEPRGLSFLEEICNLVTIPVFAIGGIKETYAEKIKQTKAAGICIMSQLMECKNPFEVVKNYNKL